MVRSNLIRNASDRKAYYAILQLLCGKNYAFSAKSDLTPWLEYFTEGFITSLHVLDAEIRIASLILPKQKKYSFDSEDQDILTYISKYGSISISEAEKLIPETSRRSIQRKLKHLVDDGVIKMVGETHDTKYILES